MRVHLAVAGLAVALIGPAFAAGTIGVELNTLTQAEAACRITFVAQNTLTVDISELGLEVALFDKEGVFDRSIVLKTGSLPIGKSRVRQFDLPTLSCKSVGRILVNDVTECTGTGLTAASCLRVLNVTTRASVPLEL
ncbi:MAG: hypothetical protein U1E56_13950 [Bauldia sp.]